MNSASAERIKQLALRSQVCGLSKDSSLPEHLRNLIHQADQGRRLLDNDEIRLCCDWSGADAAPQIALQSRASDLVDQARSDLLKQQPQLVQPGGKLFPQERAEACWRDCFHFLRVSIYGTALQRSEISDGKGMQYLAELYALLDVPVPALLLALDQLQHHALITYRDLGAEADAEALGDALTHLCNMIRKEMKEHDGRQHQGPETDIK